MSLIKEPCDALRAHWVALGSPELAHRSCLAFSGLLCAGWEHPAGKQSRCLQAPSPSTTLIPRLFHISRKSSVSTTHGRCLEVLQFPATAVIIKTNVRTGDSHVQRPARGEHSEKL